MGQAKPSSLSLEPQSTANEDISSAKEQVFIFSNGGSSKKSD